MERNAFRGNTNPLKKAQAAKSKKRFASRVFFKRFQIPLKSVPHPSSHLWMPREKGAQAEAPSSPAAFALKPQRNVEEERERFVSNAWKRCLAASWKTSASSLERKGISF